MNLEVKGVSAKSFNLLIKGLNNALKNISPEDLVDIKFPDTGSFTTTWFALIIYKVEK